MYEVEKSDKYQTKLKTCDIDSCKGMCCYDGIYLQQKEEEYLNTIVQKFQSFFSFLPQDFITDGNWKDIVHGRKTNTKKCDDFPSDFPEHFNKTICVFAIDGGKCSLQVLANELKIHKWTFKPIGCWMFPLDIGDGKIIPPPINKEDDPDYYDDSYPGYSTYVRCGQHYEDGVIFHEALKEEIEYINKFINKPFWAQSNLPLEEIIFRNKIN